MQSDAITPVFVVGCILLSISPFVVAGYMLRQIDQAAKRHEAPVRIWLVDLFSLMFLIQLPLTLISWQTADEIGVVILAVVLFSGVMTLIWWATVKTVSRAGVTMVLWRSAISLVVIPMAYVGSFAIMFTTIALLSDDHDMLVSSRFNLWILESVLIALMMGSILIVKRAVYIADKKQKPARTDSPVALPAGRRRVNWDD